MLEVYGSPPIGSQVMRGPNMPSYAPNINGEVLRYDEQSEIVVVKVNVAGAYLSVNRSFSWGKGGLYDIQLRH